MAKIWATSEDGLIIYKQLTKEYIDQALDLLRDSFYTDENVCKSTDLPGNEEAIKEMDELTFEVMKEGASIIAVEKASNKIVGVAVNLIQEKEPKQVPLLEKYAKYCKNPSSKAIINLMIDIDNACNLFELMNIDCLLEIMFLTTRREYRKRAIGYNLCKLTKNLTQHLNNNENLRQPLNDGDKFSFNGIPKGMSSICTTLATFKILEKLNFKIAKTFNMNEIEFEGRPYSVVVGNDSPDMKLVYYKL